MIEWPAFSTDEFLDAVRDAFMPGATSGIAECGGYRVRTLLRGGKAVTGLWQFPVYREPLDPATVDEATTINDAEWKEELVSQKQFFDQFGERMPKTLELIRQTLLSRLPA